MKRITLILFVTFFYTVSFAQYFHSTYTPSSTLNNGQMVSFPYPDGMVIGGIAPTISSASGPMIINTDITGSQYFNWTYYYTSVCGIPRIPINATSSQVIQLTNCGSLGLGCGNFGLATSFIYNDQCHFYSPSGCGGGASAGGIIFQSTSYNGVPVTKGVAGMPAQYRVAYAPAQNGVPFPNVTDIEITSITNSINSAPGNSDVFFTGNFHFGSEIRVMFAFKMEGGTGNLIWHKEYAMGFADNEPTARGIIQSPYNPNEVYIVGDIDKIDQNLPASHDAFIMKVDANNGTVITNNVYDAGNMDGFKSIAISNDPLLGDGFVICGYSNTTSITGKTWVLKTDQNLNIQWSNLYTDMGNTFDISEGNAVAGRNSSALGRYEYYVGGKKGIPGAEDAMVLKLDQNGMPINGAPTGAIFTYHLYDEVVRSLGILPTSSGDAMGLFCSHYSYSGVSDAYLIKPYLNGVTTCYETFYDADITPAPVTPANVWAGDDDQWVEIAIYLDSISANPITPYSCYVTSDPGGSNARFAQETYNKKVLPIQLIPNPASENITIQGLDKADYTITDMLGKTIASGKILVADQKINISQLSNGIYFIDLTNTNSPKKLKFVKQ